MKLLAQNIPLAPSGGYIQPSGPLNIGSDPSRAGSVFNQIISTTIGVLTVVATIWFVFQFISAAVSIITSAGNKENLQNAKTKLTQSLMGLVVVVVAIFLIKFIGEILGLPDILDPTVFINSLPTN